MRQTERGLSRAECIVLGPWLLLCKPEDWSRCATFQRFSLPVCVQSPHAHSMKSETVVGDWLSLFWTGLLPIYRGSWSARRVPHSPFLRLFSMIGFSRGKNAVPWEFRYFSWFMLQYKINTYRLHLYILFSECRAWLVRGKSRSRWLPSSPCVPWSLGLPGNKPETEKIHSVPLHNQHYQVIMLWPVDLWMDSGKVHEPWTKTELPCQQH